MSKKDVKLYSENFKNSADSPQSFEKIKSIFNTEITTQFKSIKLDEKDKSIKKQIKEKKLHTIKLSINVKSDETINKLIENILKDGGSNALFNYSNKLDTIINNITGENKTLITDILSEVNTKLTERSKNSDKILKSQISYLLKKLKDKIFLIYSYNSPENKNGGKPQDKIFQKNQITKYLSNIKKLEGALDNPILSDDSSPVFDVKKDSKDNVEKKKVVESSKSEIQQTKKSDSNSIKNSSSDRYDYSNKDLPDGELQGDGLPGEELEGSVKQDNISEEDNNNDGDSKSFFDTILSYFKSDEFSLKDSEESKTESPESLIKSLDVTGLFSKDKKFVPSENDNQKIEIAESELKRLQTSEEELKQELIEQTERIREYKKDIQNKISQQYALLEYEKKQLVNSGKMHDIKNKDKYYKLVDILKNRERFLDKREDILNKKRDNDIKEIDKKKKELVSKLLKQLNREKNIIIRNKNRENNILKKQLNYYKQNNRYLELILDTTEECNNKKLSKKINKKKRTLKKRKKKREKNYTDSKLFEITL